MGRGLDGHSKIPSKEKTFFPTPQHPGWPYSLPSLLSSGFDLITLMISAKKYEALPMQLSVVTSSLIGANAHSP
jgi:hypothetical protein